MRCSVPGVWLYGLALVLTPLLRAEQKMSATSNRAQGIGSLVTRAGDRSLILHWDDAKAATHSAYHVYRQTQPGETWTKATAHPILLRSYADMDVTNGQTYFYRVHPAGPAGEEGPGSAAASATPAPFRDDDHFLEYLQQASLDFFWYEANPANGLIRDRSEPNSACSIAAVGFGLSAICIGADHGWIGRSAAAERVRTTLNTFCSVPQGLQAHGIIGYRGWFYHFLEMHTATRSGNTELSSIDTALFLAGVLHARQFFSGTELQERSIRELADALLDRVDWRWMTNGGDSLAHGWRPESGFISHRWIGYNEAMLLYLLGLGAAHDPLPPVYWQSWTSGYRWQTNDGQAYVAFPPLFGHQYSHCWIDFRDRADASMAAKDLTYFENSRRATLAQRQYCIANPGGFPGYGSNVWGLTASDGPAPDGGIFYRARGAPPPENDDGTLSPTAVGGSLPFAPEFCIPALRHLYDQFLVQIWTGYGFRDGFNLQRNWWGPDVLGIDQGTILLMIENYRTGSVWKHLMRDPIVQRGMRAAGFVERVRTGSAP